ncbi:MAG TPA: threonine/serine dehydratase [Dehalococcoidia bacterium]|nr:threonine/serine dehydratase [Dehalococcoidia bacterium]
MSDVTEGLALPEAPTFRDILRAQRLIAQYLRPTPLLFSRALSRGLGCEAYVKCENIQPVGAFKVRGGLNYLANLPDAERARGVVTASTGNHGQSIAFAARAFGVRAIIAAPEGANPYKVQAMRDLGAEVVLTGKDFDEARAWVEWATHEYGYRYIHSANEPLLIAGVGTMALELLQDEPDIDVIIVPIGGGSSASGISIAAKAINPDIQVIGVQAEGAPAAYHAWQSGDLKEWPTMETFAEGLATRVPFALTQQIMRRLLDDIVLVSDAELRLAMVLLLDTTHQLAEGAGAASTAAARKLGPRLAGKKVALILSGGNATLDQVRSALDESPN